MSASLVGSEMCIRDSARATRVEANEYSGTCTQGPEPRGDGFKHHITIVPVSYTHLTLPTICSV
eukprot:1263283-Alexandrium_andersonii.AAC.1